MLINRLLLFMYGLDEIVHVYNAGRVADYLQ